MPGLGFTPLWDGRLESGDWSGWNGWQIKDGVPLDQRVLIGSEIDGMKPLPGLKNLARIILKPGDVSHLGSGVRTLSIPRPAGNGGHYTYQYPKGWHSSFTIAVAFAPGFPGQNTNLWCSGLEIHDTGSGIGPAPHHQYAWPGFLNVDINAGKDNAKRNVLDFDFFSGWKPMQWYVLAEDYLHDPANGSYKLAAANEHDNKMEVLVDKSGIGTMYTDPNSGAAIANYAQMGCYASTSLSVPLTMYFCGFMEVPNFANALSFTNSLLTHTPDPPPPPPPPVMTNREKADAAAVAFKGTTVTYDTWLGKKAAGKYPDIKATKWWQGFDWLDQIED